MLTKQKLIQTISALPDTFSLEEVIDRIVLLQKIEIGIEQANKGQAVSTTEAKKKLKNG
ncbi:MAG TPA: hypothetical protein VNG53_05685 [Bacteroidia bacterium]|nr:hypothetical protein [Bacteroidia bacterium]